MYSIVVPAHDEGGNLAQLVAEIAQMAAALDGPWELLLVDDGSQDETANEMLALQSASPQVRVIRLARRYGQSAALTAGMREAVGAVVITLDADGQNDPADIPMMITKLSDAEMVVGIRHERRDALRAELFDEFSSTRRWLFFESVQTTVPSGVPRIRRHASILADAGRIERRASMLRTRPSSPSISREEQVWGGGSTAVSIPGLLDACMARAASIANFEVSRVSIRAKR